MTKLKNDISAGGDTETCFKEAISCHQEGKLIDAERLYRQILQSEPNHAFSLHNLGLVAYQHGRLEEAISLYRQSLDIAPDFVDGWSNLGVALQDLGKLTDAEEAYRKALHLDDSHAGAWSNLGFVLNTQECFLEAEDACKHSLSLQPNSSITLNNLGNALRGQSKFGQAEQAFKRALDLEASYAEAWNNLGVVYWDQGRFDDALNAYQRAVDFKPNYIEALVNLANILRTKGQWEEAGALCKKALTLHPGSLEAWRTLGHVCQEQEKLKDAEQAYREVIKIDPNTEQIYHELTIVLQKQGRTKEACDVYQHEVARNKSNILKRLRLCTIAPVINESTEDIDQWRKQFVDDVQAISPIVLEDYIHTLAQSYAEVPFYMHYHGCADDKALRTLYASCFTSNLVKETSSKRQHKLIRVGFVVTHRHEGVFLKIVGGILSQLDPKVFEPIIICSSYGKILLEQGITHPNASFLIMPSKFDKVLESVGALACDILYYWEIGSDSTNYFMPFFRMASIQCTAWGSVGTTGIPSVDSFLSSSMQEAENAQDSYSEQLKLLKHLPCYYTSPTTHLASKQRSDFGFSKTDHIYLVAQTLYKIHPDFDVIMADILQRDPLGKVVLVEFMHPEPGALLRERFAKTVSEVLDRIVFLPRQDMDGYYSLLKLADVVLDTLHYGGGLTSLDALAFGTPIVTLPGNLLRGRSTFACYKSMGMDQLIVDNVERYAELAVEIASDCDVRETMRQEILARNSVLYENEHAVTDLSDCFIQLIED